MIYETNSRIYIIFVTDMKFKLPKILSFQVFNDEYTQAAEKVVLVKNNSRLILFEEDSFAQKKRQEVLDLLKKHESSLREIEAAMVAYSRQMTVNFPQISLMTVKKRSNMTDNEYYNARVMFPEFDGKFTEYRIYIGPKSEFPDIEDPATLLIIQQKVSMKIKEKRGWIYPTDSKQ